MICFNVILLQSERDRHSILNAYWFTSLLTRRPFRHGTDHTKGLFYPKDGSTPRNTSASTTDPSRLTTNAQITRPWIPFSCAITGYLIDLDTGELAFASFARSVLGHIRHLFRLDGLHGAGYRPLDLCSVPDYYHFIELLRVFP